MLNNYKQKKHKNSRFKLDLSYVFLIVFSCFSGNLFLFLVYSFCIVLHECMHILVASKMGYNLQEFRLSVTGASACFGDKVFYLSDELIIALAGPLTNLCLFILTVAFWWLCPAIYNFTLEFAFINLFIFAFNMLPVYSFDGGRILACLLEKKISRKKSKKVVVFLGVVLSLFLFLLFLISCFSMINFSLGAMSIMLFITCNGGKDDFVCLTDKSKLETLEKSMGIQVSLYYISIESSLIDAFRKLTKKTYSVFYIVEKKNSQIIKLDEDGLKALLKKFNPITKFYDIYKNNQY